MSPTLQDTATYSQYHVPSRLIHTAHQMGEVATRKSRLYYRFSRSHLAAALGKISQQQPWNNRGIAVARTLIYASAGITLLFTDNLAALPTLRGSGEILKCTGESYESQVSLFCQFPDHGGLVRWLHGLLLLFFATGIRPRWTAIPAFFLIFGGLGIFETADSGDRVISIMALLFVPLGLLDSRSSHWSNEEMGNALRPFASLANVAWLLLNIQVFAIYMNSTTHKLVVQEWRDGTAAWYFLRDGPIFPLGPVEAVLDTLLVSGWIVGAVTWGSLAIEFYLAFAILGVGSHRLALATSVLFHGAIWIVFGLASFSMAMIAINVSVHLGSQSSLAASES